MKKETVKEKKEVELNLPERRAAERPIRSWRVFARVRRSLITHSGSCFPSSVHSKLSKSFSHPVKRQHHLGAVTSTAWALSHRLWKLRHVKCKNNSSALKLQMKRFVCEGSHSSKSSWGKATKLVQLQLLQKFHFSSKGLLELSELNTLTERGNSKTRPGA